MAGRVLEPSKLTGLMTAIADLTRGSPTLGKAVNPDHLKLLVMQAADDYAETGSLDAAPLYDYLREQAPPREEAESVLCAFLRRAQNLGIVVEVPRPLQQLTEAERGRLAEIALGRSQSAQKASTFVGQAPTSRPPPAARMASGSFPAPAGAPPIAGGRPAPGAPAAPSSPGAAPSSPITGRTKALIAVALVAALGAALFFLAPLLGPDPVADASKLFGPPGDGKRYTCDRVMVADTTVICFVTIATPPAADHDAKLAALAAFAAQSGWPTMLFVDKATNRKIQAP